MADLLVSKGLGVEGLPSWAHKIILIVWLAPHWGWIKNNMNKDALGCPGKASCGGVFWIYRGFIKGFFFWDPLDL